MTDVSNRFKRAYPEVLRVASFSIVKHDPEGVDDDDHYVDDNNCLAILWYYFKHATYIVPVAVRRAWLEVRCVFYVVIAMIGVVYRKIYRLDAWYDTMMILMIIIAR